MNKPELPNITTIRFFLALLVVVFHISQFSISRELPHYSDLPILKKGSEAVYMFFSLSGFLIIRALYLEKTNTGGISLQNFYLRRIRRIFPLYYLVLLSGFCYYRYLLPFLGFPVESGTDTPSQVLLLGGTFFPNILATYHPGAAIEILWSIGIEEQFYMVIAPLLFLLPLKRIGTFLILFTTIYFTVFHSDLFVFLRKYYMFFYFFSFSGLLAILQVNKPEFKFSKWTKWLLYLIVTAYFTTNLFVDNLQAWLYHLVSMIIFALFILSLTQAPYRILENRWLKYFGKISYGIYMTHVFAIHFIAFLLIRTNADKLLIRTWQYTSVFILGTLILTLIIAHLSYKYIESYFLKPKPIKQNQ